MDDSKQLSKEIVLEDVITASVQIPGVKVNRNQFLAEQFASQEINIQDIIDLGPIEAGVEQEKISVIANKLILKRTGQSSIASFVAGIPGGLAMAATIPADVLQFFGMALRLAQELSYIYGAQDLWQDGKIDDERVKSQLIMYCGVMFGVSGAVSSVRVLSTQIAKTTLKKLPQKALTKTFWYPIVKQVGKAVGVKVTKTTLAQGVSKAVPVIGGVISGGLNFASMMPMANRLNDAFYKASFNYSEAEMEADIEEIEHIADYEEIVEEDNFKVAEIKDKVSSSIKSVGSEVSGLFSKFGKKIEKSTKDDPIETIKKMKELLDIGAITQEEFDTKKKELLNL
jgi:hypothetical protein